MTSRFRWLLITVALLITIFAGLSYLTQQNLAEAENLCIETGGTPNIEQSWFPMDLEFECRSPLIDNQ